MLKIAGLWRGPKAITGPIDPGCPGIGGSRLIIIKNDERRGKQPEYWAYLSRDEQPPADQEEEKSDDAPF